MSLYGSHASISKAEIKGKRFAAGLPPCRICVYMGRIVNDPMLRCSGCSGDKFYKDRGCVNVKKWKKWFPDGAN